MNKFKLKQFAITLRKALAGRTNQIAKKKSGRFPKRQLFIALNKCKSVFAEAFEIDVHSCKSRWSVGLETRRLSEIKSAANPKKEDDIRVIEYLVDYCISSVAIPQAIDQSKTDLRQLDSKQLYRLLLVVESEMGDDDEVARDFLKLLDVKSPAKCLLFQHRSGPMLSRLIARIEWVIAHHQCYDPRERILLISLPLASDFDVQRVRFWSIQRRRVTDLELD